MNDPRRVRRAQARLLNEPFIPMTQPPRFKSWNDPITGKRHTVQSNAYRDESPAQIERMRDKRRLRQ